MLMHTRKKSTHPNTIPLQKQPSLYQPHNLRFAFLVSALYVVISIFLVGFKTDELVLLAIFNLLYFASFASRRFILAFSIFIIYWIIFHWMKAFPNYQYNNVHIESLYNFEKALFGFHHQGILITPNEYFALHHATFLDLLSGLFYLCWVPVPLAFAAVLFFKNRNYFFRFSLTFFLVNIIGFIGYYLYPAAPPWYVVKNGFEFISSTAGNAAGLSRFDALTGISIFKGIYAKSSNVFAAMPSLHASYMMIVLFFGMKLRMKAWNILFAVIMCGIWFAAVYSSHHYILDVVAGIFCAVIAIGFFQAVAHSTFGIKFITKLIAATSK